MKKHILLSLAVLSSLASFGQIQLKQVEQGTSNGQVIQRSSGVSVWDSLSYNTLKDKPFIPSDLNDLSDVTITSADSADLLQWNGSAWINWTPDFITLIGLSGTSPITYNNSTGAIGLTTGNIVAGSGIILTGTLTDRLAGSGNVTIALDEAGTIGTDTTVSKTIVSGDISAGVVTIPLGATPKANRHVIVFIEGVKAPKAAVAVSGTNVTITNSSMPYTVAAGDNVEVLYTK